MDLEKFRQLSLGNDSPPPDSQDVDRDTHSVTIKPENLSQAALQGWQQFATRATLPRQDTKPPLVAHGKPIPPTSDEAIQPVEQRWTNPSKESNLPHPKEKPQVSPSLMFSNWRPDPNIPSYQPLSVPPLGSSRNTLSKNEGFVPHNSPSSVPRFSPIPPWHIKKLCRYQHPTPPPKPPSPPSNQPSAPMGRWAGSPPPKPNKYAIRPSTISPRSSAKPTPNPSIEHSKSASHLVIPTPTPTPAYLAQSSLSPILLPTPQPLLLVLDLNGTLLIRHKFSGTFTPRPSLRPFLSYCLHHHSVLIWSSATPHNVDIMCSQIFTRAQRALLLGQWGRTTLGLTQRQYTEKVQVYKRLDTIWDNDHLQRRCASNNSKLTIASAQTDHATAAAAAQPPPPWGQHNTVLIDDSLLKAAAQPHNLVQIPEFVQGKKGEGGKDVLRQVVGYLEEARRWGDASAFMRGRRFAVGEGWSWEWEG